MELSILKIFSGEKIVKNSFLNYLGAQPFRMIAARVFYNLKKKNYDDKLEKEKKLLQENGMVLIENFLDESTFKCVQKESEDLIRENANFTNQYYHGPNQISLCDISQSNMDLPGCKKFFNDKRLLSLFSFAERKQINKFDKNTFIEFLIQGDESALDPESEMHTDIFFNTHKAWLYLREVKMENAPLVYVKKSHLIRWPNIKYTYSHSISKGKASSRRIFSEEIKELGLTEEILTVKANTLVVANTMGYHKRIKGVQGKERLALSISLRSNPFKI